MHRRPKGRRAANARWVLGIFTALVLGSRAIGQGVTRLSLSDALRMAQNNNPARRAANARTQEAAAKLRGASAPPNPTISIAHGVGQNTGGLDEDYLVSQLLDIGAKRKQRIR